MEAAGPVDLDAVVDPVIARIFDDPGPFLSVYLETIGGVTQAAQVAERRWRTLRTDLVVQGAPDDVLAAIDPVVDDAHVRGATLAVIASPRGVLHVEHEPEPPRFDVGRWAPLPSVAPLLEWRQESLAHVVVLADRTGADVFAVTSRGREVAIEVDAASVEEVTKSAPGGWSQPRYQRRVENAWKAGAREVAGTVASLVERIGARVIAVAGDVHAVELLEAALPEGVRALVHEVPGGRSPDGSEDALAEAVVKLVASAAAEHTVELLRRFKEERGREDRAADGPAPTLAALARAQVATLLIHDDPRDKRTAWFGPEAGHVAADASVLRDLGVEDPVEARLPDVAVMAAIRTGAGVHLVPAGGGPSGGIGAVLRWS